MLGVLTSIVLAVAPLAAALLPIAEEPPATEEHCVAFIIGQEADGELITSEPDCFADETSADMWAQIGMAEPALAMAVGGPLPLSTFTLGRHYLGSNGTGSSIRITGSSCTGGYWNATGSWNNAISSSYNGCTRLWHYDYAAKGGEKEYTYGAGTTDNLYDLNNRVGSVSYHSS